jgi:hypothetical protein
VLPASYPTLNSAEVVYSHLFNKLEDFRKLCVDGADDESNSQGDEADDQDDEGDSQGDEADNQDDATIINQCSPAMKRTLKMDYCEDNKWSPEHIAHAKGAIQRAVDVLEW